MSDYKKTSEISMEELNHQGGRICKELDSMGYNPATVCAIIHMAHLSAGIAVNRGFSDWMLEKQVNRR
ncbi:hypothetical protein LCGC14_0611110 [marine sediment metagenome]|uniref:Uncharacterized protein n=1 Tax=marine sediment metagenome TaxID=412755 RepID=A0A0F9RC92_9ZZZZ